MIKSLNFTGKNIVITGASSGIGYDTSKKLSKMGANVILIARNIDALNALNLEIDNRGRVYKYDLNECDEINELISRVVADNGKLDGLVHCAGIGGARPLKLLGKNDIEKFMNINFYSFIELVRCFSKKGNYNNNASVIAMSSVASITGDKGKIAYCASKAALDAAVRCMAKELATKHIRVNSIRASWVKTNLFSSYMEKWHDNEESQEFIKRHCLGILDTDDISSMIAYLLSDNSKRITGTSVLVDSGLMA